MLALGFNPGQPKSGIKWKKVEVFGNLLKRSKPLPTKHLHKIRPQELPLFRKTATFQNPLNTTPTCQGEIRSLSRRTTGQQSNNRTYPYYIPRNHTPSVQAPRYQIASCPAYRQAGSKRPTRCKQKSGTIGHNPKPQKHENQTITTTPCPITFSFPIGHRTQKRKSNNMSRSIAMAKTACPALYAGAASIGLVRQREFLAWDFLCYFLFPIEKKVSKQLGRSNDTHKTNTSACEIASYLAKTHPMQTNIGHNRA